MRKACMKRRAKDEELASASMDTFNAVAFELLTRELPINDQSTERPTSVMFFFFFPMLNSYKIRQP